MVNSSKRPYKEKFARRQEEKATEPEQPKYRDRAKERREDQNPDYEPTELGAFHAVAPPGTFDLRTADAQKLSIEKSKYLGGDVEHTHLVKGLDYALLNKVRSEIEKKVEVAEKVEEKPSVISDDQTVSFRSVFAKSVYQAIFKPQSSMKTNEMFLPGRMAFIYTLEGGYANEIPTTLYRSKADCPIPEEMVAITVDRAVLDEMGKIMQSHRLGTSGKSLKKKKKEKDTKVSSVNDLLMKKTTHIDDEPKSPIIEGPNENEVEPLPSENIEPLPRDEENDIFIGDGIDYEVIGKDAAQSPKSEDMEESPKNKENPNFTEPILGPTYNWHEMGTYDTMQQQPFPAVPYEMDFQEYPYPDQYAQAQQPIEGQNAPQDPRFMTQEEKNRGLGSVFKRDDERLQQLREKDAREKDPNFISDSYSECYPGYQEYNREIVDSDDEADISKMDMGFRAKGRLHRWDFETEEEWASYNEQKEAMPKAAFQFGVKMQDGRKTRKQNRDQKLNNELHQINKILARKKAEKEFGGADTPRLEDDTPSGKKQRI